MYRAARAATNLQNNFPKMRGGVEGSLDFFFSKIHPIWLSHPSLRISCQCLLSLAYWLVVKPKILNELCNLLTKMILSWAKTLQSRVGWSPILYYFWLFLAISGFFWLFLAFSGSFWLFLAISAYFCLCLAISGFFLAISIYKDLQT